LERDSELMENLLPEIINIYKDFTLKNIGFEYALELQVAPNFTLTERSPEDGPLTKNKEDASSIGGVILADRTGNITFKATLDSRLNILKEICLPMIK
jgi:vacuolar-type H+-ATPase subunit E/Vma4